jgi:hypothetical protein
MFDRIFSGVLAFVVLAAGTFAIATEMFGGGHAASERPTQTVIELPAVQITGQRSSDVAQAPSAEPARRTEQ